MTKVDAFRFNLKVFIEPFSMHLRCGVKRDFNVKNSLA